MRHPSRSLAALLALPLLLSLSCGVSFHDTFNGTEVFKSIEVNGERVVGADLTVNVVVNQAYPVPLEVACYYEDGSRLTDDEKRVAFQERARQIGQTVLPPASDHSPADKVERQQLSFSFRVDEPGDYFLACLTPAAADNGMGVRFTIKDREAGAAKPPS